MNTERLLRLAEIAESIDPKAFDMDNWHRDKDCGTVGCVIGWAATKPDIIAQGLHLDVSSFPTFQGQCDEFAASDFTELNQRISDALFMPKMYNKNVSPRYVAKCIRRVANGGKVPRQDETWLQHVTAD